jgi:hypothetical protein
MLLSHAWLPLESFLQNGRMTISKRIAHVCKLHYEFGLCISKNEHSLEGLKHSAFSERGVLEMKGEKCESANGALWDS